MFSFGHFVVELELIVICDNVGIINSLKNVKKDVQEMRKGSECGMGFEE